MDRTHGEDKSSDMAMGADSDDFEEGELDEDFGDFDNGFNDDATAAGDKGIEHIAVNASPSLLAAEVVSNEILDIEYPCLLLSVEQLCKEANKT